ncbi:MAG: methyltransferase domain-containing protein [Phycisphaerales bacterium]|nr:MAG: methyltransferase domain-containing protein [Phycisphaerales bacterium]
MEDYVHGYTTRESDRLADQANTLTGLLHHDTSYPAGSRVLEAGCGVGAQTVILARRSPEAQFISIDISAESLNQAQALIEAEGIENVTFQQKSLFDLQPCDGLFDHIFVCFVLEHLPDPVAALQHLGPLLKPGGSFTAIEGDHGSFYCYPESAAAKLAVRCLVDSQAQLGGNALIGRQLYPLFQAAGFPEVTVSPRMVYVDASKPQWVEGFSKRTFIAMLEGVRNQALSLGLIDEPTWEKGIADLYRATEADGTFCYTFFKAVAHRT